VIAEGLTQRTNLFDEIKQLCPNFFKQEYLVVFKMEFDLERLTKKPALSSGDEKSLEACIKGLEANCIYIYIEKVIHHLLMLNKPLEVIRICCKKY
jgi:hypothetical protein